jgi:hypothetical protein
MNSRDFESGYDDKEEFFSEDETDLTGLGGRDNYQKKRTYIITGFDIVSYLAVLPILFLSLYKIKFRAFTFRSAILDIMVFILYGIIMLFVAALYGWINNNQDWLWFFYFFFITSLIIKLLWDFTPLLTQRLYDREGYLVLIKFQWHDPKVKIIRYQKQPTFGKLFSPVMLFFYLIASVLLGVSFLMNNQIFLLLSLFLSSVFWLVYFGSGVTTTLGKKLPWIHFLTIFSASFVSVFLIIPIQAITATIFATEIQQFVIQTPIIQESLKFAMIYLVLKSSNFNQKDKDFFLYFLSITLFVGFSFGFIEGLLSYFENPENYRDELFSNLSSTQALFTTVSSLGLVYSFKWLKSRWLNVLTFLFIGMVIHGFWNFMVITQSFLLAFAPMSFFYFLICLINQRWVVFLEGVFKKAMELDAKNKALR